MNVLSLFDGMSCGRIALDELGIKVDNYFACEIDKYAMQISAKNYPDIIQLGDVCDLKGKDLPKIDLLIGGSPCQGFSFAGKQLAFDDPRSLLFFEYIRLLKECNPTYFLLENVRMKREHEDVISEFTGFIPHTINSSLLSAQSRTRLYWTNIPNITQPKDKGLVLRDILEKDKEWGSQPKFLEEEWNGVPRGNNVSDTNQKASCLTASMHKGQVPLYVKKYAKNIKINKPHQVGLNVEQVKVRKHKVDIPNLQHLLKVYKSNSKKTNKQIAEETNMPITKVEHWFRTDSSFAIPSDDIWYKLKEVLGITTDAFDKQIMEFEYKDGVFESTQRVYSENGKCPTLTAANSDQLIETYIDPAKPNQVGVAIDITGREENKRVFSEYGKSPCLTTCAGGHREPKVMIKKINPQKPNQINPCKKANGKQPHMQDRIFDVNGKSHALTREFANNTNIGTSNNLYWRKLTPLECERLQTVPDNYTKGVSNSQRYKMLGNGWTVSVIKHILKNIIDNPTPAESNFIKQLKLF